MEKFTLKKSQYDIWGLKTNLFLCNLTLQDFYTVNPIILAQKQYLKFWNVFRGIFAKIDWSGHSHRCKKFPATDTPTLARNFLQRTHPSLQEISCNGHSHLCKKFPATDKSIVARNFLQRTRPPLQKISCNGHTHHCKKFLATDEQTHRYIVKINRYNYVATN